MTIQNLSLFPDRLLGQLLCIYLKLYEPREGKFCFNIGIKDSLTVYFDEIKRKNLYGQIFSLSKDKTSYLITIDQGQYKNLQTFIKKYYKIYLKKELVGQRIYSKPNVYSDRILREINDSAYIDKYGKNNLSVLSKTDPNFCHSIMLLVFLKHIKIRKMLIGSKSVDVNMDNISLASNQSINLISNKIDKLVDNEWQGDFVWSGDNYFFGSYGQINFRDGVRKNLFLKLTSVKGQWVSVKILKEIGNKSFRTVLGQIRKRLNEASKGNITIQSSKNIKGDQETKPLNGSYRIAFIHKSS